MSKKYVLARDLDVGKSYTHEDRFYSSSSLGLLGILREKESQGDRVNTRYTLKFDKQDGTTFTKEFDYDATFFENTIGGKRTYSRKQKNKKLRKNKSKQSKSKKNRRKSNNRR